MGLGDLRQRQARQERVAELEHTRGQGEPAVLGADVTQVDERQKETPCRRPGEPRFPCHVGEGETRSGDTERPYHRQAALE